MTEETIIKRKLLFDGDGTGEDKRLFNFAKCITKWAYSDESSDEFEPTFNKLLAQLDSFRLTNRKSCLSSQCNAKQLAKFHEIETGLQKKIELIKKDIESQQTLLRKSKIVKRNNIDYELLIRSIKQYPSRMILSEKIKILKKEIIGLEKVNADLRNAYDFKIKQCQVISTSVNIVKQDMEEKMLL